MEKSRGTAQILQITVVLHSYVIRYLAELFYTHTLIHTQDGDTKDREEMTI